MDTNEDWHSVDIMYTNDQVFERTRHYSHPVIQTQVFQWLRKHGGKQHILDRDPDDGFRGETFVFKDLPHAMMFKLTWGGL